MHSPLALTSGPPELPGFTAASNWISPVSVTLPGSVMVRSSPEITPAVKLRVSPSWLPIASTVLPTATRPELPRTAGTRTVGRVAGAMAAMSMAGAACATVAADCVPSANTTRIAAAPFTTWNAVRITPSVLATTPVPMSLIVLPSAARPSMVTTDGWTAAKICALVGSPDGLGLGDADGSALG